jgi:hypothetical protein
MVGEKVGEKVGEGGEKEKAKEKVEVTKTSSRVAKDKGKQLPSEEDQEADEEDKETSGKKGTTEGDDSHSESEVGGSGSTLLSEFYAWARKAIKDKKTNAAQVSHFDKIYRAPMFAKTMVYFFMFAANFCSAHYPCL